MAGVLAKGSASISINPQETEAKLIFVPDPDGLGWDTDAVVKLATESNLGPVPDQKALEQFLNKTSRAKTTEPVEIVLYQGLPPENPVPEIVTWEGLPIPSDIEAYKDETLASAPPPELFRVKVEKIKNEKKVTKSGALPFMASKEETIVSWNRKETREAVETSGEYLDLKYAVKGKKLGTVAPPAPGKPGKSVFGRPIPPPAGAESGFLLGGGIVREKNDLVSQVSGFVRIGKNWADIIPLAKPSWEITTGIDKITLFFSFFPGDSRFALPKGEEILAEAQAKGIPAEGLVSASSLDEAITEAFKTGMPLEVFPLMESRESEARVEINPDKTRAALFLRKGTAGHIPLETRAISQAIKDSGIKGYDAEKLKTTIQAFMSGKDLELKDYLLVEGKPSTRGKDKELVISAALLSEEERKPYVERLKTRQVKSGDGIPLNEITGLAFVEKGAELARVGTGSEGESGQDVFGGVIPGIPGNDPYLRVFGGLEQHSSIITASRAGLVLIKAEDRSFMAELVEYRDARIAIHISDDSMEVRADLVPEAGAGLPLVPENTLKVLAALGVKKGIDKKAVETACAAAKARGGCSGVVLARGQVPVAPGGSSVKWLVPVSPPGPAGEDGSGGTPGRAVQVKAGTVIAELSEPDQNGRPGFDIKGNEIPPEKGVSFNIGHDENIFEEAIEGQAGKRLSAARPGELSFDGKNLKIASLKTIKGDVGPATGGVKFSGDIHINGMVLPGFAVIGGSNVSVDGRVEAALISAGGSVTVAGGIKGEGKGVVRAHGTIEAAFSERATLMAVGGIKLKSGTIQSIIKTNGKLSVDAEKGRFLGGVCQARNGVDAADLGSEKGIRTEISFGQDYLVKDQIAGTEDEINKVKTTLAGMDKKMRAAAKNPPLLEKMRADKIKLMKSLEQLKLKDLALREKFEEHHESEIKIRGVVYPGVVLESHDRYYEINQPRSGVVFYFDRETGRINEKALAPGKKSNSGVNDLDLPL